MKFVPLKRRITTRLFAILLLVVSTSSTALAAPYVPPAGLGAPARRESAGTRGCIFGNPASLVALMPGNNVGWTTEAYPRFYWYLPLNQARFVEFTLEQPSEGEATPEVIYRSRFEVTGENGIMSVQLPETASIPPLAVGDRYRWQIAVFCNPNSETGELQVDGWVERQAPDATLQEEIAAASELERVGLYASNGYWFNALDQLTALQTTEPDNADVEASWAELLTSVELERLIGQSLLPTVEEQPE